MDNAQKLLISNPDQGFVLFVSSKPSGFGFLAQTKADKPYEPLFTRAFLETLPDKDKCPEEWRAFMGITQEKLDNLVRSDLSRSKLPRVEDGRIIDQKGQNIESYQYKKQEH